MSKERLDILVQRQLGVTRSKAHGMITSGMVLGLSGEVYDKPGVKLPDDTTLVIREEPKYVSRGGEKLEAGLDSFNVAVTGLVAIDLGASTGGFTDCLLQRGAARVYAVDVGYGQLAWKLRQDPRVVVMERTNARNLTPEMIPEGLGFFVADCSFISLRLVLPPLQALLEPGAQGVILIKPQFEAGKESVGRGGVVRDEQVHARVVEEVLQAATELGFRANGVVASPLLGPAGNREFLAWLTFQAEGK